MPDVCDQDTIEISPELWHVFQRHTDRDYALSWFAGIIRTHVHRKDISRIIRERYIELMQENINNYGDIKGAGYVRAAKRFMRGAGEFLKDFEHLSYSDIDILRQFEPKETITRPILTIAGKQIQFIEEV